MSDVNFRWKNRGGNLPAVQPNFVDPQGVRATMGQQGMAGYQPSPQPNMQGYSGAPMRTPMAGNPGSGEGYQFDASGIDAFNKKKERLAELEGQLKEVDAQIAQIESGTMDEEKAIAAKMAEIGDMSGYQAMLSREQNAGAQQKSATQGIENMLYDAEKLTWGLDAKSEEDRKMVKSNIEATLRRAEEQAAKAGVDVTRNPSYRRLRDALEDSDKASIVYESERRKANEWWSKARKGELVNDDIAEIEDFIERNPNSEAASQLRPLVEQYKPKTRENKAAFEKRKNDARALRSTLLALDTQEATRRINNLTRAEYKLLQDFYPELLK